MISATFLILIGILSPFFFASYSKRPPIRDPVNMITRTLPFPKSALFLATIAVCYGPSVASAEKAKHQLETIEVTAQKSVENMQSVPVSITAISADFIDSTVTYDIFDIQGYVPSFNGFQAQSATNTTFAIRGVGTSSQNYGFESSVGLYVDGIYRARQNAVINDLFDVSSVEVLRGPQGALFGKNTPSGAVIINTTTPRHYAPDGFVKITVGNDQLYAASTAANFTAIDDTLTFRIGGFTTQRDGIVDDAVLGQNTLNDRDRSGAKLHALYTPTDTLSVNVIVDYAQLDEACCAALTWQDNTSAIDIPNQFGTDALLGSAPFNGTLFNAEQFNDNITAVNALPRSKMEDRGVSVTLDWQLSKQWRLASLTGIRRFDSLDDIDSDFSSVALLQTRNDAKQDAVSQEIRLHLEEQDLSAIVGLFYFQQDLDLDFSLTTQSQFPAFFSAGIESLQPLIDGINTISALSSGVIAPVGAPTPAHTSFSHVALQEQESIALFAHIDWQFHADWTLAAGLRYTKEQKSLKGQYRELGPGIDGLNQDPNLWPNIPVAAQALTQIVSDLTLGNVPNDNALNAISPFQTDGWGYFLLGTASVLPRPALHDRLNDNQTTGSLKLSYTPVKNTLLYGAIATGFKSGGINTDRISPALNPVFDAETATTFELGLKRDWPEYDLRLNAAAYIGRIDDYQATTFTGTGFNLQNAGSIDTKGLELEITWLATQESQLHLAYARNLATFDEFEQGTCWVAYTWHTGIDDPGRQSANDPYCSRAGDRVGFEPQSTLSLRYEYAFSVAGFDNTLSIDYQYVGDVFLDDTNDPLKHVGSYDLTHARLSARLPDWDGEFILWLRNAFDQNYTARNGFDVPIQPGKIMTHPGQPRQFGATFLYHF